MAHGERLRAGPRPPVHAADGPQARLRRHRPLRGAGGPAAAPPALLVGRGMGGARRRHYARGTLNGADFRGSLGARSSRHFMPLNRELQRRAAVAAGDVVPVTMDADEAAEAEVPADLAGMLAAAPAARRC